jgi:YbbR domain-containing protein
MNKSKFSLNQIFQNNRIVLLISFVIAISIWITITPNRETDIAVTVNIDTTNTAVGELGLQILEGQGTPVSVTVAGKWYEISSLTENDIKVSAVLTDVTKAGSYELLVSAQPASPSANFSVTKVTPNKITVTFDYTYTRGFEIVPVVSGVTAAKGLIADTPVVDIGAESNLIQITGPKSVVETIDSVVAEVDVDEVLSTTTSYNAAIKVLDKNGREIDSSRLTMPVTEAKVTVPINKSKTVPIVATFTNMPKSYEKTDAQFYSLSEREVNLIGPPEVMNDLDEITLDPINFNEITPDNNTFVVSLNLPSGVKTTVDISDITVNVDMDGIDEKEISVKNFKAVNNNGSHKVSVLTESVAVQVVGDQSAIDSLSAGDVYLEYDMSNLQNASGVHMVAAVLKSDKYNNIWQNGSYQIQIRIE